MKQKIKIEGIMTKKEDNSITIKELFTEVIGLKKELEIMRDRNKRVIFQFNLYVWIVIIMKITELIMLYFIYVLVK